MDDRDPKILKRREFFWYVGTGAVMITLGGASVFSLQYLSPRVLFERSTRVNVGKPQDFAPGTVTVDPENKLYVARRQDSTFYALSSVCPHLGCVTNYRSSIQRFDCPCHGSQFDLDGRVLRGPAPRGLDRLSIEQNRRGELIVDTSIFVDPDFILKV